MKRNLDFSSCILALIGLIVAVVIGAILNGWALTYMWSWFVVPVFELPELGIVQAIGLGMIVRYLVIVPKQSQPKDKDPIDSVVDTLFWSIFWPLIFLGMGWIVTWFL